MTLRSIVPESDLTRGGIGEYLYRFREDSSMQGKRTIFGTLSDETKMINKKQIFSFTKTVWIFLEKIFLQFTSLQYTSL